MPFPSHGAFSELPCFSAGSGWGTRIPVTRHGDARDERYGTREAIELPNSRDETRRRGRGDGAAGCPTQEDFAAAAPFAACSETGQTGAPAAETAQAAATVNVRTQEAIEVLAVCLYQSPCLIIKVFGHIPVSDSDTTFWP